MGLERSEIEDQMDDIVEFSGLGTAMGLPLLQAMCPTTVRGEGNRSKPPLRMAFLYVPNGIHMRTIFDQFDQTLLLLGAPGSGKTTLLLELARDLIERAENDSDHPMPVVFNLSSWA